MRESCVAWRLLEQQCQEHALCQSQQEHARQPEQQHRVPGVFRVEDFAGVCVRSATVARTSRSTDQPGVPKCSPPRRPVSWQTVVAERTRGPAGLVARANAPPVVFIPRSQALLGTASPRSTASPASQPAPDRRQSSFPVSTLRDLAPQVRASRLRSTTHAKNSSGPGGPDYEKQDHRPGSTIGRPRPW